MATTAHEPPGIEDGGAPPRSNAGNGGRSLAPAGGDLRGAQESAPPPSSTAVWVLIAGICMTFAAFTSALIVNKGGAANWRHFTLPSILYLNTLVLVGSSVTLEIA